MQADIGSPDKYVKANDLPEVTNGFMFGKAMSAPDENGLISYEIFGLPGTPKRRYQFAYIDLGDIFVHPMAMECLTFLKKIIKEIVMGNGDYYIANGQIYEYNEKSKVPEGAKIGTGIHWLKKHLREIRFEKDGMSELVKERCNFIKNLSDDEIFISKWIVMPAFYRDVDIRTKKKNNINLMYQSLLAQATAIKQQALMFGVGEVTASHRKIQEKLNEIYEYFTSFVAGTKAFMQRHVLGKSVDYSARMVISTARIVSDTPDKMSVDYSHSEIPLSAVLECFAPFIHYGIKKFIRQQIGGSDFIYTRNEKTKEFERIALAPHWEQCLLRDNIQKLIKLYTDSKEHRLDYFTVEADDGRMVPLGYILEDGSISSTDAETMQTHDAKPLTLCELFYIVAMDTVKDKPIVITRYPIEDYQNVYPSLMNINPYERTKEATINGIKYPRFPDITNADLAHKEQVDIGKMFNDTLHLFPTYLPALGADFDGDTVTVQGIFSKNDVNKYIYSPMNLINISGSTMRGFSDINSELMFAMTKGHDDV